MVVYLDTTQLNAFNRSLATNSCIQTYHACAWCAGRAHQSHSASLMTLTEIDQSRSSTSLGLCCAKVYLYFITFILKESVCLMWDNGITNNKKRLLLLLLLLHFGCNINMEFYSICNNLCIERRLFKCSLISSFILFHPYMWEVVIFCFLHSTDSKLRLTKRM